MKAAKGGYSILEAAGSNIGTFAANKKGYISDEKAQDRYLKNAAEGFTGAKDIGGGIVDIVDK